MLEGIPPPALSEALRLRLLHLDWRFLVLVSAPLVLLALPSMARTGILWRLLSTWER